MPKACLVISPAHCPVTSVYCQFVYFELTHSSSFDISYNTDTDSYSVYEALPVVYVVVHLVVYVVVEYSCFHCRFTAIITVFSP